MRLITLISLLLFNAGIKRAAFQNENLNGTWLPVKEQLGKAVLPAAGFASQKLIVADSAYKFTAESVDKGVIRYAAGKMDIYGRDGVNAGKHFTAIYKLENDELTICYNLKGDSYPAAFETNGKPLSFLVTFKRFIEK